jgi:hypothetical protein
MANPKDEILELERRFWTGDADFYKENLDAECLIAFTQMAGVMTREDVAGTVGSGNRWKNLDLTVKGLLEPAPDVALFGYEASAERDTGEAYSALVSSGYVRRNGRWKMMFHQQTPLEKPKS